MASHKLLEFSLSNRQYHYSQANMDWMRTYDNDMHSKGSCLIV